MSLITFFKYVLHSQWSVNVPEQTATFENQTVIVTGANSGLGLEAAKYMLAHKAARVIIACRSIAKGEEAKTKLEAANDRKDVLHVWELDLASYDSIRKFAARCNAELDRLDVVICNAGINSPGFELVNGIESNLAINVVSTFLLSLLLLPKLKQTGAEHADTVPHLAIVSSDTHMAVTLDKQHANKDASIFEQFSKKPRFANPFMYPTSKLMDVLLTAQLAKHIGNEYPVIINTMNPGLCYSDLMRNGPSLPIKLNYLVFHARQPEVGVRSYIAGAASGRDWHGKYISNGELGPLGVGAQGPQAEEIADRLWKELVDVVEKVEPGVLSKL